MQAAAPEMTPPAGTAASSNSSADGALAVQAEPHVDHTGYSAEALKRFAEVSKRAGIGGSSAHFGVTSLWNAEPPKSGGPAWSGLAAAPIPKPRQDPPSCSTGAMSPGARNAVCPEPYVSTCQAIPWPVVPAYPLSCGSCITYVVRCLYALFLEVSVYPM